MSHSLLINDVCIDIPHIVSETICIESNGLSEITLHCENKFFIPKEYFNLIRMAQNSYNVIVYSDSSTFPNEDKIRWIRVYDIYIFETEYPMDDNFFILKVKGKYSIETYDLSAEVKRQRKISMVLDI